MTKKHESALKQKVKQRTPNSRFFLFSKRLECSISKHKLKTGQTQKVVIRQMDGRSTNLHEK